MLVPHPIGNLLHAVLPRRLSLWLHKIYGPYHRHMVQRRTMAIVNKLRLEPMVRRGPFAGMKYLTWSTEGVILPKILGTYEHELHDSLERAAQGNYLRPLSSPMRWRRRSSKSVARCATLMGWAIASSTLDAAPWSALRWT